MKTLGLLGGMSWHSSVLYEKLINEHVQQALGDSNSADLLIRSFNFQDIVTLQSQDNWIEAGAKLAEAAALLQIAGAKAIVLCTNTMHKVYPQIDAAVSVPIIHVVDEVTKVLKAQKISKILLLGTKFTLQDDFYTRRLRSHNIYVTIPEDSEIALINDIIFKELVLGKIKPASRRKIVALIAKYAQQGIQGVVLGCTELELLIHQTHTDTPVFATTQIHAKAAADWALAE